MSLFTLVPLATIAPHDVEALLDAAFSTDRHLRTAYKIRAGTPWLPALSFAACDRHGALLGTLQSWPVALYAPEGACYRLTLVGPVAVLPAAQGKGVGRALMAELMARAASEPVDGDALVMIGDPEYYGRFFGFSADATPNWDVPGPVERHRLLARITRDGGVPAIGTLGPLQPRV